MLPSGSSAARSDATLLVESSASNQIPGPQGPDSTTARKSSIIRQSYNQTGPSRGPDLTFAFPYRLRPMTNTFDAAIDRYLDELFQDSPTSATSLGVDGHDDQLPDLSADAFERRAEWTDNWHKELTSFGDAELTDDQQIDRDLIISTLRGSQIMREWASYKRDPAVYLNPGLSGVFSLFLHRVHEEKDLTEFAAARMEQVPELIAQGRANLDPKLASPLIVERALGQCRAGVAYFRNLVPNEVQDPVLRARLVSAGEVAAKACEEFVPFIEELTKTSKGNWAIGDQLYSSLLIEKEKLGYGAQDMLERGRVAFAELDAEMTDFSQEHFQDGDWRKVCADLKKIHAPNPDAMREEYAVWTERARQFLIDNDLVTLPEGEECKVVPSPHFQRPVLAVASYNAPPAFKPSLTGYFFVPYPPEGTSEEEIQKRIESNSTHQIPTTSIHEAYPGHHWHLVKMQSNPRKIRKVHWTSYFVEGWALYAEKVMREQGVYDDPRDEINFLEARIFRAARIIVDTSLHLGKMPHDEAVEFMRYNANLSEPTAKAEVGRYCSWPTQAPSYLTGAIEIERMRATYLSTGKGSLKDFHDEIATTGGLPIGLAERALLG